MKPWMVGGVVWALGITPSQAQVEEGAFQLSAFDNGGPFYSDVWGYRDPGSGREVAVLSASDETIFVETTDPFNPVELAAFPRGASLWVDHETLGHYIYVATEGGGGLQIFDVSDLDNIQLANTVTTFFNTAHNIRMDRANEMLYIGGANTAMPVLDLSNPTAPTLDGTYIGGYVADLFIGDGVGYFSEWFTGELKVVDLSTSGVFPYLDVEVSPGAVCHNAWLNDDETYAVTSDETHHGHLTVWDVSNPSNVRVVAEFSPNPEAVIHNAHFHGNFAHLSYRQDGYWAVDLSDPLHPQGAGHFDQFLGADTGAFMGSFGTYPFQPSGTIYVSDSEMGLYVIALAPQISHEPLPDTDGAEGPYLVTAEVTSSDAGGGVQWVRMHYSDVEGLTFQTVPLSLGPGGQWQGNMPRVECETTVKYYLTAQDSLGIGRYPRSEHDFALFSHGETTVHREFDFDAPSNQGWVSNAIVGTNDWSRARASGLDGDPVGDWTGGNGWTTNFDGEYSPDSVTWLRSPAIDLSGVQNARLRFRRWLTVERSSKDKAVVEVNGTEIWCNPDEDLVDRHWVNFDIDISDVADGVSNTRVFFRLTTDSDGNLGGWNIDDFQVYSIAGPCPESLDRRRQTLLPPPN